MIETIPHYDDSKARVIQVLPDLVLKVDPVYEFHRYQWKMPLLEKHAQVFNNSAAYPEWLEPGTPGECFENATNLARELGLTYCEGVMVFDSGNFVFPMSHAWCINKAGVVIDPTAGPAQNRKGVRYLGIPFKNGYVFEWCQKQKLFGLLDGHPTLGKTVGVHVDDPSLWLHDLNDKGKTT